MSSTNKTTHYELPLYVDEDIFNPLVDSNDAMQKIDTALYNIANNEADNASEIVAVKSRVDSTESDITAIKAQNGSDVLITTAQTLSGAVNEIAGETSTIDGRVDIVEDDLNNASTGLKVKVNALETQNGNETLTTTAQTLSGAINEVNSEADALAVRVGNIETQNGSETLDTTAQTLSGGINEVNTNVVNLTAEVKSKLGVKRIVIITDSYGEVTDNFISMMRTMCPELNNTNFIPFAYGGAGFVATTGYSWKEKFSDSGDIDTVTDPTTITDVLVLGGSNDRGASISISDIMSAGQAFYTILKNKFTNANIYVGYIGYSVNYLSGDYAPTVKQAYQDLGLYGYRPIAHANSWLHYTGYITDNVHPSAAGSRRIAMGVLNLLLGGGTDDVFNNRPTPVPVTMETGFVSSNLSGRLFTYHYGHRSALKLNPSSFMFTSASLLFNGTWQKFATIGDTFLYGANDEYHVKVGAISCEYNGKQYTIPAKFKLFNSGLYIYCYPSDELHGTNPFNLTYVSVMLDGFEADDIFM